MAFHGSVCPPFWILTVDWSGARSCPFWWRHHFQIASFSPSTLENSVFKKHRFQIAPLWRALSNGSVFGDRFRRCSVDDSRIRRKTAPFLFENGLVWTGPQTAQNLSFHVIVLQKTAEKCTKSWRTCTAIVLLIKLLFSDLTVAVAVAVVVFLKSLMGYYYKEGMIADNWREVYHFNK